MTACAIPLLRLRVIHRHIARLQELGAGDTGFSKEIDHLLAGVAEIRKGISGSRKRLQYDARF
jgi:hypothetical protein